MSNPPIFPFNNFTGSKRPCNQFFLNNPSFLQNSNQHSIFSSCGEDWNSSENHANLESRNFYPTQQKVHTSSEENYCSCSSKLKSSSHNGQIKIPQFPESSISLIGKRKLNSNSEFTPNLKKVKKMANNANEGERTEELFSFSSEPRQTASRPTPIFFIDKNEDKKENIPKQPKNTNYKGLVDNEDEKQNVFWSPTSTTTASVDNETISDFSLDK